MRKAHGLTQEELADLVSCSVETIRKIERGRRRPSKQIIERLAAYLDIPSEELPSLLKFARVGLEVTEPELPEARDARGKAAEYADLEISLNRVDRDDPDNYEVEMRFTQPGSASQIAPLRGWARFELENLQAQDDMESYGRMLTSNLFTDPDVRGFFNRVRDRVENLRAQLPIRLFIGPSAPELNNLRWETLRDPQEPTTSLLINENILFSRFLSSRDWRVVRPRPKEGLRALVVIPNPSDLKSSNDQPGVRSLTPIDVQSELDRAGQELDGIPMTSLASGGTATLDNMIDKLREGYDILYLICHGVVIKGVPQLWLEGDDGKTKVVKERELVQRLIELREQPRLVVLASPFGAVDRGGSRGSLRSQPRTESRVLSRGSAEPATQSERSDAGLERSDGSQPLATILGPHLAEAGIPAVLAMQGPVTPGTVAEFMPVFFKELQRDGQIDRAMAVARGAVRDRPDYWMPVLFMGLKDGRIWTVPSPGPDFTKWPALLNNIERGRCTPVLGSGFLEALIGSARDLAQSWAKTYHFPMAPHATEDLPQVAQYLSVDQQVDMPNLEFAHYMRKELLKRFGDKLPADVRDAKIGPLLKAVGKLLRDKNPAEPHKVLAQLPCPIYITTNPDNLLAEALFEAGKVPRVEICRWKRYPTFPWPPSIYDPDSPIYDPNYRPTPQEPLVYHLFGHVEELDSIVLKEDDYFEYMSQVAGVRSAGDSNNDYSLIPNAVKGALANNALLFLGFRMDDWDFRVLYRSLMPEGRRGGRVASGLASVAAQINPDRRRNLDPEGACGYLQNYFKKDEISIYWGYVEDFLEDLLAKWDEEHPMSTTQPPVSLRLLHPDDEEHKGGAA
jgi:transcriptional regulator with XRE-family HTH domain